MKVDELFSDHPNIIKAYLNKSSHLVLVRMNEKLEVIACNRKFKTLLQRRKHVIGQKVELFLIPESYKTLISSITESSSIIQLNFKTLSSSLFSLQSHIFKTDDTFTLFGEHATLENDEILNTLAELNSDLTNITRELSRKNRALKQARDKIKVLGGLLPICSWCKKIKNDQGYWAQLENYIDDHSEAEFSHSICPECMEEKYPDIDDDDDDYDK